jgi:hypothetical protein
MTEWSEFYDMTAEEMLQDWLAYIMARDPLLKDTSTATFNMILGEAIASQFWITMQIIKQKVQDSNILTAEGGALSALVLDRLPNGRYPGTKAAGAVKFLRTTPAVVDYVIPLGTIVAMKTEGGELLEFETIEEVTLLTGQTSIYAEAQAMEEGTAGNVSAYSISLIRTPVYGITSVTNDVAFEDGTDYESDADLRRRYIYTIWLTGKATAPMLIEHIDALEPVREVKVDTLGQGDVLIIVDSVGGPTNPEDEIGEYIYDNLAAGCTAPGLLGASLRSGGDIFEIGDCSGAKVWVRTLQYLSAETEVPFSYTDTGSVTRSGTITFSAGTPAGHTAEATLYSSESLATEITASTYPGSLSFDLFMGLGEYPYLWIGPELQEVDIDLQIVLTDTPEADLLTKIQQSLENRLSVYKIGDALEYADLVKWIYVNCILTDDAPGYATGDAFEGIDDVALFSITCKGSTIDAFGEKVTLEEDERVEPGTITVEESP